MLDDSIFDIMRCRIAEPIILLITPFGNRYLVCKRLLECFYTKDPQPKKSFYSNLVLGVLLPYIPRQD